MFQEFEIQADSEPKFSKRGIRFGGFAATEVAGSDDAAGIVAAIFLNCTVF